MHLLHCLVGAATCRIAASLVAHLVHHMLLAVHSQYLQCLMLLLLLLLVWWTTESTAAGAAVGAGPIPPPASECLQAPTVYVHKQHPFRQEQSAVFYLLQTCTELAISMWHVACCMYASDMPCDHAHTCSPPSSAGLMAVPMCCASGHSMVKQQLKW
jgi:hypothetical protein